MGFDTAAQEYNLASSSGGSSSSIPTHLHQASYDFVSHTFKSSI